MDFLILGHCDVIVLCLIPFEKINLNNSKMNFLTYNSDYFFFFFSNKVFNCYIIISHVNCHTGNSGNVNLHIFLH